MQLQNELINATLFDIFMTLLLIEFAIVLITKTHKEVTVKRNALNCK